MEADGTARLGEDSRHIPDYGVRLPEVWADNVPPRAASLRRRGHTGHVPGVVCPCVSRGGAVPPWHLPKVSENSAVESENSPAESENSAVLSAESAADFFSVCGKSGGESCALRAKSVGVAYEKAGMDGRKY